MKKIFLLILITGIHLNVSAQNVKEKPFPEGKVVAPEIVRNAFAAKYPTVKKAKWSLEKAGEYEVEFKMNKTEVSALFDEKGTLLEVETEIGEAALSQAVKATLAKDFIGYKIGEIDKVEAKGVITYEMEVKKNKVAFEAVFENNGKLISKADENEKGKD